MNNLDWQPIPSLPATGRVGFIRALRTRFPHLANDLTKAEIQLDWVEFSGNPQNGFRAREKSFHEDRLLVPTERLAERRAAQAKALRKSIQNGAKLLILSGVGIGDVCKEILGLLREYPYVGFLIVEQEPVRVLIAATLFDLTPLAECANVLWAVGENAVEQTLRLCRDNSLYLIPHERMDFLLGGIPTDTQEAQRQTALVASLPRRLEPEREQFESWAKEFVARSQKSYKHPGRVWSYHSARAYIHLPLLRALLNGFEKRGWRTHCELAADDFASSLRLSTSIIRTAPDLYVFLNGPSSAFLGEAGITPGAEREIRRPRILWIVDDLTISAPAELRTGYSFRDHIFCADRTYLDSFKHCGAKTVSFLPAAAAVSGPGNCRAEWAAPISYVGSIQNMEIFLNRFSRKSKEWLRHVVGRKERDRTASFQEILQTETPSSSIADEINDAAHAYHATTPKAIHNPRQILHFFLYVVATYFQRKRVVESLLPHGLRVFGPESWLEVLPASRRDRYGGFVPFEQVADVYASADLSLNLHSFQCPTCLNSRDFDVIMAGGCLITDWIEDFNKDFFDPSEEIYVFRSDAELIEAVQILLADPDRREQMKTAARNHLLRAHTYAHRVDTILQVLQTQS